MRIVSPQVEPKAPLHTYMPLSVGVRELQTEEISPQSDSPLSTLPKDLFLYLLLQSGLSCRSVATFTGCCKKFLLLRADPQIEKFFTYYSVERVCLQSQALPHSDIQLPHAIFSYQQTAPQHISDFGFSYTF